MAQANKICQNCGELGHSKFYCKKRKWKRPKQQSDKELEYQIWKEEVARPFVIERDGIYCKCPGGCNAIGTDLEHELGKGTRPDLKRDLNNLRLFCRFPCHRNKEDHIPCIHNNNRAKLITLT